jgi:uncharacterized protein (TIGR00369 family)
MPTLEERARRHVARQGALALLGAELAEVGGGEVALALPFRPEVAQHFGFFHGGVVATMLDNACGTAAVLAVPPEQDVVSAEFKLNFLAPAQGPLLVARGRVVKAGRTLLVCQGVAYVGEREVALMQATMMAVRARAGA